MIAVVKCEKKMEGPEGFHNACVTAVMQRGISVMEKDIPVLTHASGTSQILRLLSDWQDLGFPEGSASVRQAGERHWGGPAGHPQ